MFNVISVMKRLAFFCTAVGIFGLSACHQPQDQKNQAPYETLTGQTMGTSYHITYQPSAQSDPTQLKASIDEALQAVNQSMSTYDPNSTISKFNALKAGESIQVEPMFVHVLTDSQTIYQASGKAFDPTVYPLVQLWGFGSDFSLEKLQRTPDPKDIQAAQAKIGLDKVILTQDQLSKTTDGVGLDFSAIAKGYGVDVIAGVLHDGYMISNYMVEIGGEVATLGVNAKGKPWTIAIDAPIMGSTVSDRKIATTISQPKDKALHLATSGNYRNMLELDGVRYSHTISPTTAKPVVNGSASVSVIHDSTALADGWATALSAVSLDEAIKLANEQGIKAVFINPKPNSQDHDIITTHAYQAAIGQHQGQPKS